MEIQQPGGGGGTDLTVTDGVTTVTPVSEINFVGATVTNDGGGTATVTINSATGYTGELLDSTYTKIADVEDGLIKSVVFSNSFLLLEDGFYLLLESGDKLVLE